MIIFSNKTTISIHVYAKEVNKIQNIKMQLISNNKCQIIPKQHKFFSRRSVETNLITYLLKSLDSRLHIMASACTDLSNGFDKINHMLITKLNLVGVD